MRRRPPRSTPLYSSAASDVYKRQSNIRAVNGTDREAVAREIADASILCTAVGVNVLKHVAPAIAMGIRLRADAGVTTPLNIIICENLLHASDICLLYTSPSPRDGLLSRMP